MQRQAEPHRPDHDVMSTQTTMPPTTPANPAARLRGLLENSLVMTSTRDDVTICVTKEAYDNAYATAYPPANPTPRLVAEQNMRQP